MSTNENKKYLFGWTNIKWVLIEFIYTFSNKPSFFSRKRIESFVLFVNAMILLDYWYFKNINIQDKIQLAEAMAVFTAQMVYAGFQVGQIRKDLEKNVKSPDNTQNQDNLEQK